MKRVLAAVVLVLAIALIGGVAAVWLTAEEDQSFEDRLEEIVDEAGLGEDDAVGGSGFLEAHEVLVSSESSGTVTSVAVAPGDSVASGDLLVVIRDDELTARLRQAEAAVSAAEAQRDRVLDGPSAEQLRAAQAAVEQAEASAESAEIAWRQALTERGATGFDPSVNAAQTAREVAQAALDGAEARLALVRQGATEAERRLAQAGTRRARASLDLLRLREERLAVRSPITGTVGAVVVSPGAAVTMGAPLLRLGRATPITLTVFVSGKDLPEVDVGDEAEVTVDAFEDETFTGRVTTIASEAEFTPRNVQTSDDRATLVYAVTIELANEDGRLKPGMPADAEIRAD